MEKYGSHIERQSEEPAIGAVMGHLKINDYGQFVKYFSMKEGYEGIISKQIAQNVGSLLSVTNDNHQVKMIFDHLQDFHQQTVQTILEQQKLNDGFEFKLKIRDQKGYSPNVLKQAAYNLWSIHYITQLMAWSYEQSGVPGIENLLYYWFPTYTYASFDNYEGISKLLKSFTQKVIEHNKSGNIKGVLKGGNGTLSYLFDPVKNIEYAKSKILIDPLAIKDLKGMITSKPLKNIPNDDSMGSNHSLEKSGSIDAAHAERELLSQSHQAEKELKQDIEHRGNKKYQTNTTPKPSKPFLADPYDYGLSSSEPKKSKDGYSGGEYTYGQEKVKSKPIVTQDLPPTTTEVLAKQSLSENYNVFKTLSKVDYASLSPEQKTKHSVAVSQVTKHLIGTLQNLIDNYDSQISQIKSFLTISTSSYFHSNKESDIELIHIVIKRIRSLQHSIPKP